MSSGADQWFALPVSGAFVSHEGQVKRYIIVGYSNPDPSELPNHLGFCLPLVHRGAPGVEPSLLACFDPESVVPVSNGLYWEEDELKYDQLEDWDRFWKPLEQCLWTPGGGEINSECQGASNEPCPKQSRRTLDEILYKDALTAHVRWWSESMEKRLDEIQG